MKILIACSQYPPMRTGFAKTTGRLAMWFARLGHDVEVVTEGRGCYRVGKVAFLDNTGKDKFRRKPDIVQIIGPTPFFSEQCVKFAKKEGLRVVYHVSAFPGLSSYYHNPIGSIIDAAYKRLNLYRNVSNCDLVVSNTHDFAESSLSFYDGPIEIIPNGIDVDEFNGHPQQHKTNGNRILFVGQLRRYKGLPFLIQAVKQLREQGKDLTLDIVGGGPDKQRIETLIARAGLQSSIFLHGELSDEELSLVYDKSTVLVLPSVQAESFGIVLLEAASHGLPVIATDLPGVREVVEFLGGTIVPTKNSDALAKAVERALDYSLAYQGTTFPRDAFSWKNIAMRYLDSYSKILGIPTNKEPSAIEDLAEAEALEVAT
jgi:glycosyltransferase involved in cell wall biosynthesis